MIGVMAPCQETPRPIPLALVNDRSRLSEMIGHAAGTLEYARHSLSTLFYCVLDAGHLLPSITRPTL